MNFTLSEKHDDNAVEMRKVYCDTLIELAEKNDKICVLDADLMAAMGTKPFAERFPERTIDCGIQEANMIGVACGLSVQGKIPFAHTFAPFCTRRACDQIFLSGAYNKANVKVIGSDPGITAAYNGGTHMPFEDMGIMRLIPGMTVIEPTDNVMLGEMVKQVSVRYGMCYLRLVRRSAPEIYKEGSTFEIGKAVPVIEGKDATVIASGYCVKEAIDAAKILAQRGISVRVLDMFTWKPLDEEAVIRAAKETGAIVTAENHNIINGLGAAVSQTAARCHPVPMEYVGIQDEFGEVGPVDYLRERFGLTAEHIVSAVERVIKRK